MNRTISLNSLRDILEASRPVLPEISPPFIVNVPVPNTATPPARVSRGQQLESVVSNVATGERERGEPRDKSAHILPVGGGLILYKLRFHTRQPASSLWDLGGAER